MEYCVTDESVKVGQLARRSIGKFLMARNAKPDISDNSNI